MNLALLPTGGQQLLRDLFADLGLSGRTAEIPVKRDDQLVMGLQIPFAKGARVTPQPAVRLTFCPCDIQERVKLKGPAADAAMKMRPIEKPCERLRHVLVCHIENAVAHLVEYLSGKQHTQVWIDVLSPLSKPWMIFPTDQFNRAAGREPRTNQIFEFDAAEEDRRV